jgi:hypothetical protein
MAITGAGELIGRPKRAWRTILARRAGRAQGDQAGGRCYHSRVTRALPLIAALISAAATFPRMLAGASFAR